MFKSKTKILQLMVTLAASAFLLVPTIMSVLAGVTVNYFKGISHFKDYRTRLVSTMDQNEIIAILDEVAEKFSAYEFSN